MPHRTARTKLYTGSVRGIAQRPQKQTPHDTHNRHLGVSGITQETRTKHTSSTKKLSQHPASQSAEMSNLLAKEWEVEVGEEA